MLHLLEHRCSSEYSGSHSAFAVTFKFLFSALPEHLLMTWPKTVFQVQFLESYDIPNEPGGEDLFCNSSIVCKCGVVSCLTAGWGAFQLHRVMKRDSSIYQLSLPEQAPQSSRSYVCTSQMGMRTPTSLCCCDRWHKVWPVFQQCLVHGRCLVILAVSS